MPFDRVEDLAIERFYERLLDLAHVEDVRPTIDKALEALVELSGASWGHLHFFDDTAGVVPRALIEQVLVEKRTIVAINTSPDPIGTDAAAVICTPIGTELPIAVLALSRRIGRFAPSARDRLERLARQIALVGDRLSGPDSGRSLREDVHALRERKVRLAMERHRNNISAVARELGISRMQVYRVLNRHWEAR